jgi:putative DNA primase/helicase
VASDNSRLDDLADALDKQGHVKPAQAGDDEEIARLAALPPLEYERTRKDVAERLGARPTILDKLVGNSRKDKDGGIAFDEPDPWPHPIDPAQLLSEIAATVQRFIVCNDETAHAVALWVPMTWMIDVVQVAPLAVITAPEKRCGKSQLLILLGKLVCRPLTASNISPSALFRSIDAWKPTLLVDEADAFMRENEELRGLLNCGHTRDNAYIVRVVGENFTPTRFNVWGAKALAGIGHLADTIMDRSIALELRRKLPHEEVERLRHTEPGVFETLASKLARFAQDFREAVRVSRPNLPPSLNDRAQDNWEPLLAIADVAGAPWPELAWKAALKLSGAESPTLSIGTELLADIQEGGCTEFCVNGPEAGNC